MIWRNDNFAAAVIGIAFVALWPRLTYLDEVAQDPFLEVPTAASWPYVEAARGEGNAAVASPLYPLFLRGFVAVGLAPRYVQVLLSVASCALLALIGRALWGPGTGLIAALCAALYGPAVYFTGSLLPPVLAVFLVLLLLAALLWADQQSGGKAFLGVGLLLALCLLTAPQVALFAPVVLWWLWIGGKQRACWTCALGTAGAVVLWYFLGIATNAGGSPDLLVRGGEHLPALDMYHARGDSAVLATLLWKWGLAFPFGLVLPLALLGMGFAVATRERGALLVLLFVATGAVGTALYGAHAETRMVLVPVLLLFAVSGVGQLAQLSWAWKGVTVAGLVLIAGLVNASTPAMDRTAQASQHRHLGRAYAELGMTATAIAAYEQALAVGSTDKDVYRALAALYDASGKPERALGISRAFVSHWPADERGQRALGDRYMAMGRSQQARTIYQQLVAGGQESLLGRLGDAQLTSGALDEAIQSYERLLTLRPDSSRVRYQLARAYAASGQVAAAEQAYRQLLDSPVYGVQARLEAAALLRHNGQLATAEPLLSQVLALAPDHREGLLRLGEVLLEQGRPDEALPHWLRLAELEPHNWRIQGHLSRAYSQLGRDAEARDAEARYQREKQRAHLQQRIEVEQKALAEKILGENL
ncbi:MAG: tetratricopeptide repeat protein [Gemmatimonadetes bacterium]|nr:tetratricopeptide repeat protein [Gemmatimonadota bacterium]MXW81720.1 tetratricopeptide repeat protein [Gemmatimonadota bacterium]MYC73351.1 tetratricopeptide repeat protein [Gemmatimonadota bacterium]MYI60671.1 tetratricopeptide repeat protein [Gemmatimonadota bacterium]